MQGATAEILSAGKIRAAQRIHELCDSPSDHVSLDASRHLLAVNGIRGDSGGTTIINTVNQIADVVVDLGPDLERQQKRQGKCGVTSRLSTATWR